MQLTNLRCEFLFDPLGIDVREPRLSWELQDMQRGVAQVAYRVLVAYSPELLAADQGDLWDSGRVESGETLGIAYAGRPLASRTRCYWKARAWAQVGEAGQAIQETPWSDTATWSMGLLDPSDWLARWIGDPTPPPPDSPPHNGYRSLPAASPETDKWVAIDLGALRRFNGVRLYGARIFEAPPSDTPGYLFPLRFRIDVSDEPDFGEYETVVDHSQGDMPNPGVQPVTYRFEPTVGRYVRLLVTRLRPDQDGAYGYALAEMEVLDGHSNLALGCEVTASDSWESAELGYDALDAPASSPLPGSSKKAWSKTKLVDGDIYWHSGGPVKPLTPPMLRREFVLPGPVRRATLYATALGVYEIHLNGQRVGDHILAPEWTDYGQGVQYQTYDVTGLLRQGANVIGALLGDGHYAGRVGMTQSYASMRLRAVYGRKPRLRAQLEIELDGRMVTIATDGAWRSTTDGPIRLSDIYDGEVQDARRELPGWDQPGYDENGDGPADWRPVEVDDTLRMPLVAQMYPPIRIACAVPAQAVHSPERGVYILDLGQDITGWVRLKVCGRPGQRVTLRHAEALDADGRLYTAMLRGAAQTDHYTLRGDPQGEVFEPHFTYHGFRYVEVSGLDERPRSRTSVGRPCTRPCARPACSNAPAAWLTSCGRISSGRSATYRRAPFSIAPSATSAWAGWATRRLSPIRPASTWTWRPICASASATCARHRRRTGAITRSRPTCSTGLFPRARRAGATKGAIYPWVAYTHYGDRRLLEEQYESAKRWVEHTRACSPGLISPFGTAGDWLNADTQEVEDLPQQGGAVPGEVYATAFFAYRRAYVAQMATVLWGGLRTPAAIWSCSRPCARCSSACSCARMGASMATPRPAMRWPCISICCPQALRSTAVGHMVEGIRRYGNRVSTGFQATHRMMLELSRGGQNDLAYALLHNRACPSWGYMIDHGRHDHLGALGCLRGRAPVARQRRAFGSYLAAAAHRRGFPDQLDELVQPCRAGFRGRVDVSHDPGYRAGRNAARLQAFPGAPSAGAGRHLGARGVSLGARQDRGALASGGGYLPSGCQGAAQHRGHGLHTHERMQRRCVRVASPGAGRAAPVSCGWRMGTAVLEVQSGDYAFVSPGE